MQAGMKVFDLTGKIALITGATGYLGSEMAIALAESGAHILINSRSYEQSEALVQRLFGLGYSSESAVFDVTDPAAIEAFFIAKKLSTLDILINNAYLGQAGSIENSNSKAYTDSFDIAVIAAHNLLKAALPLLRSAVVKNRDASVINIASMYGIVSADQRIYNTKSDANPPFYGAAKAALLQWTRYAACEFGAEGIRVNSISPGPFPSLEVQKNNPTLIKNLKSKVPLGRIGESVEIRGPVIFLASPASSFVNGANLIVDGGWTCW
jgi:NAD(P)-dependent dehydrogenase (short-subunit alcohol dehydrogenase family)